MRPRGAVIVTAFGLVWALAGASGLGDDRIATTVSVGAVVIAVAVAIVAWRSMPIPTAAPALPATWERTYNLVNVAQGAPIAGTVVVCVAAGVPELIPPVACLIVGAHFLPLAGVFRTPLYRLTGVALVAVGVAGLAALAASAEAARAVTGLGAAIVLWMPAVALTRT